MKKYLMITCAVFALAFTACKKGPTPEKEVTFQIEVSDITSSEASVSVTPSDPAAAYYFDVISAEYYADFASDEALVLDYIDYFNGLIEMYAQFGYDLTIDSFLSVGPDDYDFSDLAPATDYYVFAFQLDSTFTGLKGTLAKKPFTTLEVQNIDLSFAVQYTDTAVWFLPNNKKANYLANYIDADTLAASGYTAEESFHAYNEYIISYNTSYYGMDFTLSDIAMYGDIYIPFESDGEVLVEADHNYYFMAQAVEAGVYNSDFISISFARPSASAAPALNTKGQMNKQIRMKKAKKLNVSKDAVIRARK